MNVNICVVGTINQLFIKGSGGLYAQIKFFQN